MSSSRPTPESGRLDEGLSALIAAPGARAFFRDVSAWGVEALTADANDLDDGFHVVVLDFEGTLRAARMRHVERHDDRPWWGARALDVEPARPAETTEWQTSLDRAGYENGVREIRRHIARGDVYQVNLCRTLTQEADLDPGALFLGVLEHNPARHAAYVDVRGLDRLVSASPETFLRRDGVRLASAPIKGTAVSPERMLDKDVTENVMITDLVRNDLQQVCEPGTVAVEGLLSMETHPGLVHLVSTVVGEVRDDAGWREILAATSPPGSVSGTPKLRALDVIRKLEPTRRGPYCGAIGWIDADSQRAELAVGIRTFWWAASDGGTGVEGDAGGLGSKRVHFGVGAGITWDSQPEAEWDETELKAHRLLSIAAGAVRREQT